ncbi:MAG: sigma-70 family RNA polymerase sigma factor [Planctomycetes bacterium]|nr:sigma-70 family RNA polymerase sigma factor [Planctomycetota bacterium]
MKSTALPSETRPAPRFVHHESFEQANASRLYGPLDAIDPTPFFDSFMPDDVTRDTAKRMHYAAFRLSKAKGDAAQERWRQTYFELRDRIVVGNRKLAYRAVRRRMALSNKADDLIGDCHIVLIQAVAAYNPWMGIRFSTYAFTCLIRALARLAQRASNDWFSRSMSIDSLPDGEPGQGCVVEPAASSQFRLDDFLREDHPLLSAREKIILSRRFNLKEEMACPTLENVGRELGLSKERVRQVQATALGKLRQVLLG